MKKPQKKNERVTIKHVAAAAGVTIGTVSNVINGTAVVSEETKAQVKAAIEELHYVPNMTAKFLRSKKNKSVGILIPDLNNSFYYRVLSAFINQAFGNGYIVRIFGYEYSLEKELQIIDSLIGDSVDIVIILSGIGDEAGIQRMLNAGKKVILADRNTNLEGVKCLYYDNYQEVFRAIGLLKEKGYQNVGFLSEPSTMPNVGEREKAFREAVVAHGLPLREENIYMLDNYSQFVLVNGYEYVKRLLDRKEKSEIPDAFLVSSDLMAIGTIKALKERGLKVPEDIGIIGFDNLDISSFVEPNLTTIEQDQEAMGCALFRMVQAMYEGEEIEDKVILQQKLIVRDSC